MFKMKATATFEWPVKVEVPSNGSHEIQEFGGKFLLPTLDELQEAFRGRTPEDGEDLEQLSAEARDKADAFMKKHWIGWDSRMCDESGKPLVFSEEARDALLRDILVRPAVVAALFEGVTGRKRKNSKAPRAS